MAFEFRLPNLGEGIASADIANLLVAEGDVVTAEQNVMELETDKAVIELPCPQAGKITKLHVKQGATLKVGDLLMTIDSVSATNSPAAAPSAPAPQKPAAAPAATKPAPPAPAPVAAKPATPAPAPAPVATAAKPAAAVSAAPAASNGAEAPPAPAGPATRRLARELGVDLHQVKGTGPGGRISSEDVQAFVRGILQSGGPAASAAPGSFAVPPLPDFSQYGPVQRQPMNKLSRTAATNLSLSWNVIPHVTQHDLADITELETGRKRYSAAIADVPGNAKVTMTVLALKAAVTALQAFPQFNSSFDAAAGEVIYKQYYHLGVAVDTENGLVVPVIRNVDQKSIHELAVELAELSAKARSRKLAIADMQGGTFTITNLGGIGGTGFTPIVNYPEVAILGLSKASLQQVIVNGKPEIRLMMPVSLSYDHRVINGADAARFVVKLCKSLSDPFQLLSEI